MKITQKAAKPMLVSEEVVKFEYYENIYTGKLLKVTGITKKGNLVGVLQGEKFSSEYGPSHYKRCPSIIDKEK